jgi:membrane protease YdiL (CAAX protease family)
MLASPDAPHTPDPLAARLRGFGPVWWLSFALVLAASLVTAWLGAIVVLAWAFYSRTPWRSLGFVRPTSWPRTLVYGSALGIGFKLLMKAVVMPLLGAPAINQAFHDLVGNPAAVPGFLVLLVFGAGFGEETLYRGYLFERLGKLLGSSLAARIAIVLVTSTLFAAAHLTTQGRPGAEQALVTGVVFGSMFAATRRLPFIMVTHVAFDVTAYAIIYFGLETRVAHWVLH